MQSGGVNGWVDDRAVAVACRPLYRRCIDSRWRRKDKLPRNARNLCELVEVHVRGDCLVLIDVREGNRVIRVCKVLRPDVGYRDTCAVLPRRAV